MGQKSLWVTYLLWFFFGWYGVHHFYLGRDRQAFVWACLCGGYFGLGWFTDVFRIPGYVRQANNDADYVKELRVIRRKNKKPPFKWSNFVGQLAFANAMAYLYVAAIPEEPIFGVELYDVLFWLMPVAVALGVHTVGNFDNQEGGLTWALIGAAIPAPLIYVYKNTVSWSALVSAVAFHWKDKKWRRPTRRHGLIRRIFTLYICGAGYSCLLISYLYFNCQFKDNTGETIKFRDAVSNFMKSPMWKEFIESIKQLQNFAKVHGWAKVWEEIVEKLDPHGEKNALTVLGLDSRASQEEITAQYKRLLREWHPDLHKDAANKEEAAEKFMAIQAAYDSLSVLQQRRKQKNRTSQ